MADAAESPPEYDPVLASELFLQSAHKAYLNIKSENDDDDVVVYRTSTGMARGDEVTLTISKRKARATLVFRGSTTGQDWLTNVSFASIDAMTAYDNANIGTDNDGSDVWGVPYLALSRTRAILMYFLRGANGIFACRDLPLAHRGFTVHALRYSRWLEDALQGALGAGPGGGMAALKSLTISGHSLGGASADALAFWCALNYPHIELRVYTYAAPRLGNEQFRHEFCARIPCSFAHEVSFDVVPYAPPWNSVPSKWVCRWLLSWSGFGGFGYNPAKCHLYPGKCLIPWMMKAYPGAYEEAWGRFKHVKVWNGMTDGKPMFITLEEHSQGLVPGAAEQLVEGQGFVTRWVNTAANPPTFCLYVAQRLARLMMHIAVLGVLSVLGYVLFLTRYLWYGVMRDLVHIFTSNSGLLSLIILTIPAAFLLSIALIGLAYHCCRCGSRCCNVRQSGEQNAEDDRRVLLSA